MAIPAGAVVGEHASVGLDAAVLFALASPDGAVATSTSPPAANTPPPTSVRSDTVSQELDELI